MKTDYQDLVAQYLNSGGTIKKSKRAVWARGAKNNKTMKVATKSTTYSRSFDGPIGLKQTNLELMGQMSGPYNGTKYVLN